MTATPPFGPPVVLAPLRAEARALRRGAAALEVVRCGVGRRAARALHQLPPDVPLVVAGVAGGLAPSLRCGDVVVATHVDGPAGRVRLAAPDALVAALQDLGVPALAGPVVTVARPALGRTRSRLAASGALVADMESAWVVAAAALRPVAVIRVVLDTPRRPASWRPAGPWRVWSAASARLAQVGCALADRAAAVDPAAVQPARPATATARLAPAGVRHPDTVPLGQE